ncbi:predicted protein [Nematostella vectensis]|uniref:Photolyase/cryptochrome alpha/beta domain-containing protein n=1 Tax=Nematostella vectensis TaxID=45351 RepID=A7RWD1_NEMVE|nr:predicted protein [Nematostella vectensis]|eukprot:XP_001636303.1 predicted protein [Nematostella vectensis]
MASKKTHQTVHWFRNGLRLHDNPALKEAFETSQTVRPLYVLDPDVLKNGNIGVVRWRFILESLADLDNNLKKLNSRLFVVRGRPSEVFPKLFKEWKISKLTFEVDTTEPARKQDAEVLKIANKLGVDIEQRVSHTLYDLDRIVNKNGGTAPLTYKKFQSIVSSLGPPAAPLPAIDKKMVAGCNTPTTANHDKIYGVPTLEEIGQEVPEESREVLYPGGETEALERLEVYMKKEDWVCKFEKPNTAPNSIEPSTTVLSPYMTYGCLSARLFYTRLAEIYAKKKKHSQPPVSLHGQLLWREFFTTAAYKTPNFNKMVGNSLCLQVPWDQNDEYLAAWAEARTGYPYIDAIMTQLRREGWVHHLARHSVACFLTRGDLWISWEEGLKVFERLLIDHDWNLNAGNWMWLSASSFFHAYFRVYSPVAFGKKTDPNGDYIRKYIPKLSRYPPKYIYEPWNAPLAVQEKAGCVIGRDYPCPIVDHNKVVTRNMSRMKEARSLKYGKTDMGVDKPEASFLCISLGWSSRGKDTSAMGRKFV